MAGLQTVDKNLPILIVDDFATMRRMLKDQLKALGFENVTEAQDGCAALTKLNSSDYGLIISDWNMPHMMGLELLKMVRKHEKLKDIPFLMVTAETQTGSVNKSSKEGASECIMKPLTAEGMQEKLESIFSA